jgi:hypothetical protein
MYGWLVKEQRGRFSSPSGNSVKLWLNALSYILPGPGQAYYTLPAKGGDALTSGQYLNVDFFTGFHGKNLSGKKSKK